MATIDHTVSSTDRQEAPSPIDMALARIYTLNWEYVAYTLIFVVAMLTRFWDLGARVMSHDESLHTYYSWELYDRGHFSHTPLMHGPLLFHATAFFYFLFGPNDFSARIYIALLGVAIIMFPLLFRRWLGRIGALLVSIGFLISPMLLYYSRYIRHDIPTIFFALVMLYATMQYVDSREARRPIWIAVLAGATSLILASKEVSFIYIAIFGSFLTMYWLLRMVQDVVEYRKTVSQQENHHDTELSDEDAEYLDYSRFEANERPPLWLWTIGVGVTVLIAILTGYFVGAIIEIADAANMTALPSTFFFLTPIGIALVVIAILNSIGFIRTFAAGGEPRPGMPWMVANGLQNMRSTVMLITAGVIIGGIMSLWVIGTLDIIKVDTIFRDISSSEAVVLLSNQQITETQAARSQIISAIAIPIGLIIFAVTLVAVLKRATWQDLFAIFMVAFLMMGILVFVERHSHPPTQGAGGDTPVAIDPDTGEQVEVAVDQDDIFIYGAWIIGALVVIGVLVTRLLTNLWEFLNRQPIFDVLIVMGTLIVPWLAAFPLYWAGYKLDDAPLQPNTLSAGFAAIVPFLLVSIAVGLSWNWRVWPIAAAVFAGLFIIFFTTFFSNGHGIGTGVIGSLGYWLEQQDVRRGSQPQYYYTLIQLPFYEFLPAILSIFAGFFGLSSLFEYRNRSIAAKRESERKVITEDADEQIVLVHDGVLEEIIPETATATALEQGGIETTTSASVSQTVKSIFVDSSESGNGSFDTDDWVTNDWQYRDEYDHYDLPAWAQPYNHEEELKRRNSGDLEYLGGIPFLQLVGYWAILILVGLTIAGEKMPWLTTHLTLPLIFIGGWYVGRVAERIKWSSLHRSGWVMLLLVIPVFFVATAQMILPIATGVDMPFQGRTQAEIGMTGKWFASLLGVAITGYFMLRLTADVGFIQTRRLMFGAATVLLAILTMRSAWLFSFINYDYATEFGVYAHSGPAVKNILDDLNYFADHSDEGMNIRIAYDAQSTWPMLWYLRDFTNTYYIYGENAEDARTQADNYRDALVVIVGNRLDPEVRTILGDDYYRVPSYRLWWPMQEYFHLTADQFVDFFQDDSVYPPASLYRRGVFDIWWQRDYNRYGEARCMRVEIEQRRVCDIPNDGDVVQGRQLDPTCVQQVRQDCIGNAYFNVENWPVSDEIIMYVKTEFAAQVWDSGLDGLSVTERLIPDPEDAAATEVNAIQAFGSGLLTDPRGIVTDADGNLYVADPEGRRVAVFASTGSHIGYIGDSSIFSGAFSSPWGLAINPVDGNLYVADTWNHRIIVFTPEGEMIDSFGDQSTFFGPRDVTVDLEGRVYVADTGNHRIRVYDPDWNLIRDIAALGEGLQNEPEPVGLAVHPISGDLYVAETWNQRISVFSYEGTFIRSWHVNMWAGTRITPHRPYLAISPDGTIIYVSDMDSSESNHGPRVVGYDLSGQVVISFNAPFVPTTETFSPSGVEVVGGIAFGNDGEMYVADTQTGRIVVFPSSGLSGGLAPVQHPTYGRDGGANGDTSFIIDEADVRQIGRDYWETRSLGNYERYQALHCAADRADESFPQDPEAFSLQVQSLFGADLTQLSVIPEINGNTAIVRWSGNIIFGVGTEQQRIESAGVSEPIQLVKQNGVWYICSEVPLPDNTFRPGGG